jgi:hypothetical protein
MVRSFSIWTGGSPTRILQMESLSFRGTKELVKLSYLDDCLFEKKK